MEWSDIPEPVVDLVTVHAPQAVAVILLLLGGAAVAMLVRAALRRGLAALRLNDRLQQASGSHLDAEDGVARVGFYVVWLVVGIALANALNLELVTEPLQALVTPILGFLPGLLGAVVLGGLAWVVATVAREVTLRGLRSTRLDDRLAEAAGTTVSESLASVLYWLVILLFVPPILDSLGMESLLAPVQSMFGSALAFLPNVFAAALIAAVGLGVGHILRSMTTNLLSATGLDSAAKEAGLDNVVPSRLLGTVVQVAVVVPAVVAALDALRIEAISAPATAVLDTMLSAIPDLLVAGAILGCTWLVTRLVVPLVVSFAAGAGADGWPERIGLDGAMGERPLSEVLGRTVGVGAMLFAAVEAADQLGLDQVGTWAGVLVTFAGQVLLGGAILLVGLQIARWVGQTIERSGGQHAAFLATLARVVITGLVLAMGLDAMGVAETTVNLAFGLTLGAAAVAVALSFGLGGREPAGRLVAHWLDRFHQPSADVSDEA
ncbi:MAG: mechanosensitive ion channel [Myxococcales bacterium]|nr:mechanosensitive ion channel [Myxococcales bacterium]